MSKIELAIQKLHYLKGASTTPIIVISEEHTNEYVDRINNLVIEIIDILNNKESDARTSTNTD